MGIVVCLVREIDELIYRKCFADAWHTVSIQLNWSLLLSEIQNKAKGPLQETDKNAMQRDRDCCRGERRVHQTQQGDGSLRKGFWAEGVLEPGSEGRVGRVAVWWWRNGVCSWGLFGNVGGN